MSAADLRECRRLLAALVAAVEAGELGSGPLQLSALYGALVAVESLLDAHKTDDSL